MAALGYSSRRHHRAGLNSATRIMATSPLWLDAEDGSVAGRTLRNRGYGGAALDAALGPQRARVVDGGLRLPGLAGNYASIPDAAALDITGDIEVVVRVKMDDWTPAAQSSWVGRSTSVDSNRAWFMSIDTTGYPVFSWYPTGAGASGLYKSLSTSPTWVDGATYWLKATLDVDNGAAGNTLTYYYAADQTTEPVAWTQIGSPVVTAGVTSLPNVTAQLNIGRAADGNTYPLNGTIYRTIVRNGIGGTTVADVDFTAQANDAASFVCTTGQTVTVTGTTASTNDPLWLAGGGTAGYVYNTGGSTANSLTVPDVAAHNPTTSLDVRCVITPADWTPSGDQAYAGKYVSTGNQRAWRFIVATTGVLRFVASADGTTVATASSSAAPTVSDGAILAIRALWEAATPSVKFYTKTTTAATAYADSISDSGWTQLGSTQTGATVTAAIFDTTAALAFMSDGNGTAGEGSGYAFALKVDGALVVGVNCATGFTSGGVTSFTATTGQTVTVNRATSGRKTVLVPTGSRARYLLGTDDFLEIADNALLDFGATDSFTVGVIVRQHATLASQYLMSKIVDTPAVNAGWLLQAQSNGKQRVLVSDGTTRHIVDSTSLFTAGTLTLMAGVVTPSLVTPYVQAVGSNATARTALDLSNATTWRIGPKTVMGGFPDMEFVAAFVSRRVLTDAELTAIMTYYGA